jgi:methionyl aminopeptidase
VAIEPFATDGLGRVGGKRPSHIFRFARGGRGKGDAARLLDEIDTRFSGLPFAERWCAPLTKRSQPNLRQLVRAGGVTEYAILAEEGNGIVSQAEHTVLVLDGGNEITTL